MDFLNKIFGINWATTILGIGVIFAAVGRVVIAWKAKDFTALANDGQLIMTTLAAILTGIAFLFAKDRNVNGVGSQATTVASDGKVKNVEGEVIDRQPVEPPK